MVINLDFLGALDPSPILNFTFAASERKLLGWSLEDYIVYLNRWVLHSPIDGGLSCCVGSVGVC